MVTEFVYSIKTGRRFHGHAKCTYRVLARFTSLLFAMRTSKVATAYKKVTMITSTHILTLSSLRWKGLHFLLSRINKLNRNFFHWHFFHLFASWETTWHRFYPISYAVKRVQRWRVSWKRSIAAVVAETSFRGETSGGVAKCRLFSQTIRITVQKLHSLTYRFSHG